MKRIVCLFAVLWFAAYLAFAEDSNKSNETLAPLSRVSLGTFASYWNVPDLDGFDLGGGYGGGVLGQIRLHKYVALELRTSFFEADHNEELYVQGQGSYETQTAIVVMPLEAGLVFFLPLAENFSLYGGPGAGYYFFDGETSSSQDDWETFYDIELDDNAGFYVLFGGSVQLARNVALFFEGKYTWVNTSREHEIVYSGALPEVGILRIDDEIDFSGLGVNAGLIFTF
jgi:hypothetical protein